MEIPVCIYITSYPEHAAESFELDTLDYIVKPLKSDRFSITVQKIEDYLELKIQSTIIRKQHWWRYHLHKRRARTNQNKTARYSLPRSFEGLYQNCDFTEKTLRLKKHRKSFEGKLFSIFY
jgi:two-component SAPR family response regulator